MATSATCLFVVSRKEHHLLHIFFYCGDVSALRNNFANFSNSVFDTLTLERIARALPVTSDELLLIEGCPRAKVDKFGADILHVTSSYATALSECATYVTIARSVFLVAVLIVHCVFVVALCLVVLIFCISRRFKSRA